MSFTEYCTESENRNGCLGTECLPLCQMSSLTIAWLTRSFSSQPPLSITNEGCTVFCQPGMRSKFSMDPTECMPVSYYCKVGKS